ncbi:MAG: biopolymer transporter ExbD [Deltaproteobacteria bacterium]
MASKIFAEEEDVIAEINIVPFVDIVLVLLITFMLTSSAIVRASIAVELPTAASAGAAVTSSLNIVLDAQGKLYLDGRELSQSALAAHVARVSWQEKDLQAVISADKSVSYGLVVQVIDLVKSNGVKTFALNIQREL